jgi:hypothetical protein
MEAFRKVNRAGGGGNFSGRDMRRLEIEKFPHKSTETADGDFKMKAQTRPLLLIIAFFAALTGAGLAVETMTEARPPQDAAATAAKPAGVSDADLAAIKQTALDYIEGYYDGNAERMERALSPDLAKRIVFTDPKSGRSRLDQMSAMSLVQGTRARAGRPTPKDKQQKDVTVLDAFENAASVKVVANDWIDYLHVSKFNGRWVIVNVLWELKPQQR